MEVRIYAPCFEQIRGLRLGVIVKHHPAIRLCDGSLLPQRPHGSRDVIAVGLDFVDPIGHDDLRRL